jgi:diketogulonate reductase-like aldo/keto reductase
VYNNERELGVALEESGVPRSELFITNKTLNLDDPESALADTLANLKMSYVDMQVIPFPLQSLSPMHCRADRLPPGISYMPHSQPHLHLIFRKHGARWRSA